jgi:hypothetical protein
VIASTALVVTFPNAARAQVAACTSTICRCEPGVARPCNFNCQAYCCATYPQQYAAVCGGAVPQRTQPTQTGGGVSGPTPAQVANAATGAYAAGAALGVATNAFLNAPQAGGEMGVGFGVYGLGGTRLRGGGQPIDVSGGFGDAIVPSVQAFRFAMVSNLADFGVVVPAVFILPRVNFWYAPGGLSLKARPGGCTSASCARNVAADGWGMMVEWEIGLRFATLGRIALALGARLSWDYFNVSSPAFSSLYGHTGIDGDNFTVPIWGRIEWLAACAERYDGTHVLNIALGFEDRIIVAPNNPLSSIPGVMLTIGYQVGNNGTHCPGNGPRPNGAADLWGVTAVAHRGQNGAAFELTCPPGSARAVWGTGVYTDDSSVCSAAVHAGRISANTGGRVVFVIQPGLAGYQGTTSNGVASRNYGPFVGSFTFQDQPALAPSAPTVSLPPTPPPPPPPPPPASCEQFQSCGPCAAQAQCGWCATTNSCMAGTQQGSPACPAGWLWLPNQCGPAAPPQPTADTCPQYTNCVSCAQDTRCGWCVGTNSCMGGAQQGSPACPAGWLQAPNQCGGP